MHVLNNAACDKLLCCGPAAVPCQSASVRTLIGEIEHNKCHFLSHGDVAAEASSIAGKGPKAAGSRPVPRSCH